MVENLDGAVGLQGVRGRVADSFLKGVRHSCKFVPVADVLSNVEVLLESWLETS